MGPISFVDLKTQYKELKSDIDARIQKVLDHTGFINGPEVAECEQALAQFAGTKFCIAVASGTDALLVPMMALGIKPGDEIITTPFSFVATAETIHLAGATPIYVDIDPETFNIDTKKLKSAITPRTKGIIPVSLYGQVADMDEINAIAKQNGLWVMEDAAQSFGATYKNQRSCNLSLVSATSFFPSKPLGGYGDGGAIFTNDEKLALQMKEIKEHGSEKRYYHTRLGLNGRLDSLQCTVITAKLKRFPWEIEQRNKIAQRYNEGFKDIKKPDFKFPKVLSHNKSVWAQYTITVSNRDEFQKGLTAKGVPTSVHYPRIIPDQPWYREQMKSPGQDLPLARWAADHVISLPMYPDLPMEHVDEVIRIVKSEL